MRSTELFLHIEGKKRKTLKRLRPGKKPFMIGTSPTADIRLEGDKIENLHALVVFKNHAWYVCDVSGKENLKVNNESVVEAPVASGLNTIEIGSSKIELFSPERETTIFTNDKEENFDGAKLKMHQVIVRGRGGIIETKVLKAGETYAFFDGDMNRELPCPPDSAWVKTDLGGRIIMQRLVPAQEIALPEKPELDKDLRNAVLASLLLIFVLTFTMIFMPKPTKPEAVLDKKSIDVIYNAQQIKLKREESKKIVKTAKARAGGNNAQAQNTPKPSQAMPEESEAPKANPNTSQALTSIRNSGLSALIGKVAKRANKQGIMIGAIGASPDQEKTGRAAFSVGTTLGTGGGVAAKNGSSYKLGGIGTAGRGGGIGNIKDGGTALAGGSVGTGNVAMLEEETVIEGGLDRDVIAEVIRRNLGQIRYCYERQLSANPDLFGKVMVRFQINGDGTVAAPTVDSTSLRSAMVEGCMMRRIASWKFPLPKGGTQVRVAYPFLFKALQ